jgi:hypothetical protein
MKVLPKILRILTAISSGATSLSVFDLNGIVSVVPGKFAGPLLGITVGIAAVKELAVVAGDYLDNGKRDGSFKCAALAFIAAGVIAVLGMTSCVSLTTAPDGTVTEKRPDSTAIERVAGFGLSLAEILRPAPKATPIQGTTTIVPEK